jgi:uroporphyrinogen decarboxylase
MAYNDGPMFGPASFEKVFLSAYRRMIKAYKEAGARYVFLHSDGDIRPLLDMLIDAGIDGINPLERRAHMDAVELRKRYPGLILTGGMCNTDTLINGPISRIQAEARQLIDLGREGGLIIGTHSVSPEIPLEHFAAYDEMCRTYGNFSGSVPA